MGGQPQFRFFQLDFFECANIVLLVFDLNRYSSFANLKKDWLEMVEKAGILTSSVQILIGNKLDLGQTINDEEILQFADEHNMKFFKISAKEGTNLAELERHLMEVVESCFNEGQT